MSPRSIMLVLLVFSLAACQREASEESPENTAPAEPPFTLGVQPLPSPAQGESAQAQLTSSSRGVLLSWLEQKESTATLKFAELGSGAWSPSRSVASSDNWFVSDADVPTVLRMSDGTLVATMYPTVDLTIEAYDLRLAYSRDDGKTWSRPLTPHHDRTKTQHGFASLFELPDRSLGLVWLDGREQELNKSDPQGGSMDLYFASFDSAWKQTAEASINARVCECCQTAAAVTEDGPLVAFRDRTTQEVRDVHVTRIEQGKWLDAVAVHADNWRIDACPVNGPALSTRGRTAAVAWFTAVGDAGHAYAAFSQDAGRTWDAPVRLDDDMALGHVDIELLEDGSAAASWVEFANERAQFRVRQVKPSRERSQAIVIAGTGEGRVSGYPRIARTGNDLVLAWTESAGPGASQIKTAIGKMK